MQTAKNNGKNPAAAPVAMTPPPETQAIEVFDYGDDACQGFENQDMSDRKLPIIELLQSNSPEVAEYFRHCLCHPERTGPKIFSSALGW